ncbi:MAG: hypothetical protein J3Q66DRAFT_337122 [Benniella sp.]|nr:MAG: hypothetical protein J3Q66DRAFT_337122 [Benniella sp.]
MVNKPPKPAKAPKANKRVKHQNTGSAFMSQFSDDSLFARSQQFVKENDAKPFRDFSYMMFALLGFIIWRLYVAQQGKHDAGITIWSSILFGSIVFLNLWAFFLVQIVARRGGDIGIVKITDDDIVRFISISGLFGAWAGIICTFIDSLECLTDNRKG